MTLLVAHCKITVLKRTLDVELISEFLDEKRKDLKPCEACGDPKGYIVTDLFNPPKGFCNWAWADIRHAVARVATGGQMPGLRMEGVEIAGCTDWFRPVIFKIERID
jgi:uncharacterized repeat protein (TIGR04076 family)